MGAEAWVGEQQHDIGVVMGKPSVLRLLLGTAGVSDADILGDDDVRRAGVDGWVVIVERDRWPVVDLPERDSGAGGIIFEDFDAGVGIGGALQPEERDVIFRRPNAGRVFGGFRVWNIARLGEQRGRRSAVDE